MNNDKCECGMHPVVGRCEQLTTGPSKLEVKGKHRLLPDPWNPDEYVDSLSREDLLEEIQRLQDANDKLRLALTELCQLKAIKDKYGKTKQYRLCQPAAWDNAFRLLQEKDGE